MKNFIVKMQLSQFPYHENVLVYNEDRSVEYESPATEEIIDMMDGEEKAFFNAKVENQEIVIGDLAPWQDW